jgi:hypothetical protein
VITQILVSSNFLPLTYGPDRIVVLFYAISSYSWWTVDQVIVQGIDDKTNLKWSRELDIADVRNFIRSGVDITEQSIQLAFPVFLR